MSKIYPLYDLANYRYQRTEITTHTQEIITGQFVDFKVIEGTVERQYPNQEYCFCPSNHVKEYFEAYNLCYGRFSEKPKYIRHFKMGEIVKIVIMPVA